MIKQDKLLKKGVKVKFITGVHKNETGIITAIHKNRSRIQVGDIINVGVPKFHVRDRFISDINPQTQRKTKIRQKQNGFIHRSNVKIITKLENEN